MGNQIQIQKLTKCAYPPCGKLFSDKRFKNQQHCSTACSLLHCRLKRSQKNKELTKQKRLARLGNSSALPKRLTKEDEKLRHQFAMSVYEKWKGTNTPIYKFDYNHQIALKYAILSIEDKQLDPVIHAKRLAVKKRWDILHRKQRMQYEREYNAFVRRRKFAKFWDSIENGITSQ